MKIVSLLPSSTEIVCALGLESCLVGVTHECDYPPSVRALPKVTRTLIPHDASSAEIDALVRERLATQRALYTLDLPVLEQLAPDLLVTQALCDVCAVAEAEVSEAARRLPGSPRVLNLEPMSLEDVFETLRLVGAATDRAAEAERVVTGLRARVAAVAARTATIPAAERPRVAFGVAGPAVPRGTLESGAGGAGRWGGRAGEGRSALSHHALGGVGGGATGGGLHCLLRV